MGNTFEENIKAFGLTGQEASIYFELLKHGEMTGYEVSKETGISRSNVYSALNSLVEKGAAYLCEGEATKYQGVEVKVFTQNVLKELRKKADIVLKEAPKESVKTEGYVTIKGTKHIGNKIEEMLKACELRVYIMAEGCVLEEYRNEIETLIKEGKKVVVLTDNSFFDKAIMYKTVPEKGQLRLIIDSSYVLTGSLEGKESDTCLYSGQANLVAVMKEALKNKITLIQMGKEN